MSESKNLNKRKKFRILYNNPQGARYYQGGKFFGVGGRPIMAKPAVTDLPEDVKHLYKKEAEPEEPVFLGEVNVEEPIAPTDTLPEDAMLAESDEVTNGFQCPHCDMKPYKEENWLKRHMLAKHDDMSR